MRSLQTALFFMLAIGVAAHLFGTPYYQIDYDQVLFLDAEALAEEGINDAYKELEAKLSVHIKNPVPVVEQLDHDLPSYAVICEGVRYPIFGPDLAPDQSWNLATYAFFQIVNKQLQHLDVKFYALYSGNDLSGIFLTTKQYELAVKSSKDKSEQPYLPKLDIP